MAACRATRAAFDYSHLVVHAPASAQQSLQDLRCALRHCSKSSVLDLRLHMLTSMPGYGENLLEMCQEEGAASLPQLQAFRCSAADERRSAFDLEQHACIRRYVQWLLCHMPNLTVLSMRVQFLPDRLSGLQHLRSVKHFEIRVMDFGGGLSCPEALRTLPSSIETISIYEPTMFPVMCPAMDVRCLPNLRLLVLGSIPDEVVLPPGCRLHGSTKTHPWMPEPQMRTSAVASVLSRLTIADMNFNGGGPIYQSVLRNLTAAQTLVVRIDLPGDHYMGAGAFAPLHCLRQLTLLLGVKEDTIVELSLPASIALESLAVRAHHICLHFDSFRAVAPGLKALNLTSYMLETMLADGDPQEGAYHLQDVLEQHLQGGLSLGVGDAGDVSTSWDDHDHKGQVTHAFTCVYIRRGDEEGGMPADMLSGRCICGVCWDCLQAAGKL